VKKRCEFCKRAASHNLNGQGGQFDDKAEKARDEKACCVVIIKKNAEQ